jgi:hypothetical protein
MKKLTENRPHITGASIPRLAICKKTDPGTIPMNTLRFVSLGMLLGLLCAIVWVPAALGSEAGIHSYSGDDVYEPVAGGPPALSVGALAEWSVPTTAGGYSGDDAYDQAAGGTPEQSIAILVAQVSPVVACSPSTGGAIAQSAWATGGDFSGDDDYDPVAAGAPELSLLAFVADGSLALAGEPVAPSD